jgi:hypothetical protein
VQVRIVAVHEEGYVLSHDFGLEGRTHA